jgi:hypothetical protein
MPDSSLVASDRPAVARHGAIRAIPAELPSEPPLVESAELRTTLYVLARRWGVVAATTLLGVGASVWLARRSPPVYRAEATVRLTNPGAVLGDAADAATVDRLGNNTDPLQSRLQLLRSRGIAERAVRLDSGLLRVRAAGIDDTVLRHLAVRPDAPARTIALDFGADSVRATWSGDSTVAAPYGRLLTTPAATFSVPARPAVGAGTLTILAPDAAAAFVQRGLRARTRDHTDVVDVTFDAGSPVLAQRAVNLAVRAYGDMLLEKAQGQHQRRLAFIGTQLKRNDALLGAARLPEPASRRALYTTAAAEELIAERATALQRMRDAGVVVLDVAPDAMAAAVVNQYLELKARGAL